MFATHNLAAIIADAVTVAVLAAAAVAASKFGDHQLAGVLAGAAAGVAMPRARLPVTPNAAVGLAVLGGGLAPLLVR